MSEIRRKTTSTQSHTIVEFMEKNPQMVTGRYTSGDRLAFEKVWAKLALKLNSDGFGPVKSAAKWQQVWKDLKHNAKKKASRVRLERHKTGGGAGNSPPLTELEKRILAVMEATKSVDSPICRLTDDSELTDSELTTDSEQMDNVLPPHTVLIKSDPDCDPVDNEFVLKNSRFLVSTPSGQIPIKYENQRSPITTTTSSVPPSPIPSTQSGSTGMSCYETSMLKLEEERLEYKRRKIEMLERDLTNRQIFYQNVLTVLGDLRSQNNDGGSSRDTN